MALGVYQIAQIAYHLYVVHHSPAMRRGPDLEAISAALSFAPGNVFDPDRAFTPFCELFVHRDRPNDLLRQHRDRAGPVRGKTLDLYASPDDEEPIRRWPGFVRKLDSVAFVGCVMAGMCVNPMVA
jgi:hypothetical protein